MRNVVHLPQPTLERLPLYYRCLKAVREEGHLFISSSELGSRTGFDDTQIRKDLSYVWGKGKPGRGYDVENLTRALESLLGLSNNTEAVLVGAGRLGTALAEYPGFSAYGLDIIALFDSDPSKIGTTVGGKPILPVSKLTDLCRRLGIQLGVITVPVKSAPDVADALIKGGVKAIWSFAPVKLRVPEDIVVRVEDLAVGLVTLSYHLANESCRREGVDSKTV